MSRNSAFRKRMLSQISILTSSIVPRNTTRDSDVAHSHDSQFHEPSNGILKPKIRRTLSVARDYRIEANSIDVNKEDTPSDPGACRSVHKLLNSSLALEGSQLHDKTIVNNGTRRKAIKTTVEGEEEEEDSNDNGNRTLVWTSTK